MNTVPTQVTVLDVASTARGITVLSDKRMKQHLGHGAPHNRDRDRAVVHQHGEARHTQSAEKAQCSDTAPR